MFGYIVKKLLTLIACLAVAIIGYNFFWGDEDEQQESRRIIAQVQALTSSVTDLLKSEKEKYDQGKYDDAFSKMEKTLVVLKEKAMAMGTAGKQVLDKLSELQRQENELADELMSLKMEEGVVPEPTGGMTVTPPGTDNFDSAGDSDRSNRFRRAEEIRQRLLELNQDAARIANDFT